jgi:hypothetical protein
MAVHLIVGIVAMRSDARQTSLGLCVLVRYSFTSIVVSLTASFIRTQVLLEAVSYVMFADSITTYLMGRTGARPDARVHIMS